MPIRHSLRYFGDGLESIHLDTLIGVVLNSHTATSGCGSISDTAFQTRGSTAERLQSLLIVCTGAP